MSTETVRIAGASGFWGDSQVAIPQLLRDRELKFIAFDYLAEVTMSLLAAARARNRDAGWARDFVEQVAPHLGEIARRRIRLVSNAGGVNPEGCASALRRAAAEAGVKLRIAVVEGDDVLDLLPKLRDEGVREFQTGAPLPERLATANAYLGALAIRRALDEDADVVVTGRCVDSAVTLGALMHSFDWRHNDYDKLAQGSLAGHIIECGCQATGGLHTDWRRVPDWPHIGYPIIEVAPDGRFVVSKPSGTGGLIAPACIAEQILYEVGDPARYILPDVVCDFTSVRLTALNPERVLVEGARGLPPTDTYKVSATYPEGFRATAQVTIIGFEAPEKADRTAEAVLTRTRELLNEAGMSDYSSTLVEILGAETAYGPHASRGQCREVVMRLAVAHPDRRALEIFAREIASSGTSWAPGTTGHGGRPAPSPVFKQFSFLLDKRKVSVRVRIDDSVFEVQIPSGEPLPSRPPDECSEIAPDSGDLVTVPLVAVAWGRSGDKGDHCNVGIVARLPELLPHLRRDLTSQRVREFLAHLVRGPVTRYEVPGFEAFNFVLESALGGGGTASLRNDPWGKAMAQILLSMPVRVPAHLVPAVTGTLTQTES